MKHAVLILALLIAASLPVLAIPVMMEAGGIGQGRLAFNVFYQNNYQHGDNSISNGYVTHLTSNPYLFESSGAGLRITYGLLDCFDMYVSYLGDRATDDENIEPFDVPSTVSIDSTRQLSGGAPSVGLKYSFLNLPFDMSMYLDYEPASYRFEYKYTNWGVMPPAPGIINFDYTRTSYAGGLIMGGRLGVITPYVNIGCRSIAVEETMKGLDFKVNGTSAYMNIGFRWRIFGDSSFYADESVDSQVWDEGSDQTGTLKIAPANGQTITYSYGLMLVI